MNGYGFDYMNYIANVPGNMNYSNPNMGNPLGYVNPSNYMDDSYISTLNEEQLYNPIIGLEKGNLFKNLYDKYKNYEAFKLNPSNEKQAMMIQLMQYKFALIES